MEDCIFLLKSLSSVASEMPPSPFRHSFKYDLIDLTDEKKMSIASSNNKWKLSECFQVNFNWRLHLVARSPLLVFFSVDRRKGKKMYFFALKLFWWWPEEWRGSLKGSVTAASQSTQKKVNISAELGPRKVKFKLEILYKKKTKLNLSKVIRTALSPRKCFHDVC